MAAKNQTLPPAVFLMGPTAAGKTGLAVDFVEHYPMEIISVDSAMVFRDMDIGTAKPDAATLKRAPHQLINIRDPAETYSAAEFREDALEHMEQITANGRIPLLVGGTMLYFRALSQGLATLPPANPGVRQRIESEALELGWPALHERLAGLDPDLARCIHPNDPQRIQRALEVIELTGRPMSELQNEFRENLEARPESAILGYRSLRLVVCPDSRATLHQRIEQRFESMLEEGFLDEVERLRSRGDLHPALPSMRCVGYRQAWSHLDGEISREQLVLKAQAATRQLAKRQLTWLRQETEALWYDLQWENVQKKVYQDVDRFLES